MRLEHDVAWFWEEWASNGNVCLEGREVLIMLYYIDQNCYFKNLLNQLGNQTDIF